MSSYFLSHSTNSPCWVDTLFDYLYVILVFSGYWSLFFLMENLVDCVNHIQFHIYVKMWLHEDSVASNLLSQSRFMSKVLDCIDYQKTPFFMTKWPFLRYMYHGSFTMFDSADDKNSMISIVTPSDYFDSMSAYNGASEIGVSVPESAVNLTSFIQVNSLLGDNSTSDNLGMIIPLGFGLYTLSLLTFLGNAMVVHVIRTERKLRTVNDQYFFFVFNDTSHCVYYHYFFHSIHSFFPSTLTSMILEVMIVG